MDWTKVNERRIEDKTQEIYLYCAQKRSSMTPRSFDLARSSLDVLLDNIEQRYPRFASIVHSVRKGMSFQNETIASCSMRQAHALALSVVYDGIGDDLNLYPVSVEQKLMRTKVRGLKECDIPQDEMTTKDFILAASFFVEGENFSTSTMRTVFCWFQDLGLDVYQTRVYSYLFRRQIPISLNLIPQCSMFFEEYKRAAKELVKKGYISEWPGGEYCITEVSIA